VSERLAALDIGTNTVLLTVAERRGSGLRAVLERAVITRLGKGVDQARRLSPEAMDRTLAVLREYRTLFVAAGTSRVRGVCTSAVRDAVNGDDFLRRASAAVGADLEVITGSDEAELTFAGALTGLELEGPVSVFDVGGGSTEIIHGRRPRDGKMAIHDARSLDVGSVRLTERHLPSDPPTTAELAELVQSIDDALARLGDPPPDARWVGVAGTVTTLAAMHLQMSSYDATRIHGSHLGSRQVAALAAELGGENLERRLGRPGLEPGRADVIVAGAFLVSALIRWAKAETITVSDRGVRWGLLDRMSSEADD
jgi:exopolyphosphatase / guanosine-5'-triphosphate,3'-diphosphate pyrophosphatase